MRCPFCHGDSIVKDSRPDIYRETYSTRRRRLCIGCNERFTTYEICPEAGGVADKLNRADKIFRLFESINIIINEEEGSENTTSNKT